ncbi:hypothetical protein N0V83_003011 [Neocucurbitaria cava]|uniref:Short chain dehydrogenase n=1 Tax=Neocucurbitaria cava TaxID=798079 RepID=A0A9W8YCN6_9PLEO|nr:hypothetical protein N0V83_003011 [Neocucurbitaria cava]
MPTPQKQVALVVGASRGIGRQIAIDLAKEGYAALPPDPNSRDSTISTVAREIQLAGGTASPIAVDVRSPTSIQALVSQTISIYGRLDVLVYNSGAIWWSSVANTPLKRFQLMQQVNVEGLYATLQASLPHFEKKGAGGGEGEWKGRIIVVSPPIYSRFFRGKAAYAVGKVGMSVLTKGLAMDFQREGKAGMAVTSIWPATAIQSAATQNLAREDARELRHASIFSDAVVAMIKAPVEEVNGELLLDEDFLRTKGVSDFEKYSVVPMATPRRIMPVEFPDLRVREQDDEGRRMDSAKLRAAKL